jgi:hypothetical protein
LRWSGAVAFDGEFPSECYIDLRSNNNGKEKAMVMSANKLGTLYVDSQMQAIRNSWSPQERQLRAALGQQKQDELATLLEGVLLDADHWAVGAPDMADLKRLAS